MLIIDDTLSSLDVDTELNILKKIKKEFNNKFLVIISSRISTIYSMDKILVLDSGEIVEDESSEELSKNKSLLKNCLIYKKYYQANQMYKGKEDRNILVWLIFIY